MHIFITGTDTNIGKTLSSAWLCLHSNYDYFKPIQTGLEEGTDSQTIQELSPKTKIYNEAYCLPRPLSPHLSARLANQSIELNQIKLPPSKNLIIEGAGGLLVPLNAHQLMIDAIKLFSCGVILVCSSKLGTINHSLLSIEALRRRDIPILGVIINGPANPENSQAICHYGKVSLLAELPFFTQNLPMQLQQMPLSSSLTQLLGTSQ